MLDIPGTLRGHWFREGATDNEDWDVHLAFAYELMDPTLAVYARGQSGTLQNISFTPNSTGYINREFVDVTADGNIYCYEPDWVDQRVLVRMDSSVTLTLEDQLGAVCADGGLAFSGSEVVYER
jgi:hypothetical protein